MARQQLQVPPPTQHRHTVPLMLPNGRPTGPSMDSSMVSGLDMVKLPLVPLRQDMLLVLQEPQEEPLANRNNEPAHDFPSVV